MYAYIKHESRFLKNLFKFEFVYDMDKGFKFYPVIAELLVRIINKFTNYKVRVAKMQPLPKTKIDMDLGQNIS